MCEALPLVMIVKDNRQLSKYMRRGEKAVYATGNPFSSVPPVALGDLS